ncbi:MAG: FAD-dependent oxidoreductase [bacterium]|nr:FAD-dependent oxidoreductase [bacterium]
MYDAVIVGGGPAGLAAAIYLARQKLSFAFIAGEVGGQTEWSSDVENYLGFHLLPGNELVKRFRKHLADYKDAFELHEGNEVHHIAKAPGGFTVKTFDRDYITRTVLLATGSKPRLLKVPGETLLVGKGVSYCATCDAPLFPKKSVFVVGGGNAALDASLFASKYAKHVTLVTVNDAMQGDRALLDRVHDQKNIAIQSGRRTVRILGRAKVIGIVLATKDGKEQTEKADGVFIETGIIPNADFIHLVKKDRLGQIVVDKGNRTSVEGIWAAGDVTDVTQKQIAVAVGEGAKAALSLIHYVQTH